MTRANKITITVIGVLLLAVVGLTLTLLFNSTQATTNGFNAKSYTAVDTPQQVLTAYKNGTTLFKADLSKFTFEVKGVPANKARSWSQGSAAVNVRIADSGVWPKDGSTIYFKITGDGSAVGTLDGELVKVE